MSSTAHHFMIMLKPLRQQATSASCHFNVLSIFFPCVFAPHFSEASSPLPTAIGYEAAAKPRLEHVTQNEPGKRHTKRSERWLPEENSLLVRKRRGQARQWQVTPAQGQHSAPCSQERFPGGFLWDTDAIPARRLQREPLCASLPQLCGMPVPIYHLKLS